MTNRKRPLIPIGKTQASNTSSVLNHRLPDNSPCLLKSASFSFSPNLIAKFENVKDELITILLQAEPRVTATEEFRRALRTLRNVYQEGIPAAHPLIRRISAYLPYNNVLYSYILYGVVPALLSHEVCLRPSRFSSGIAQSLHEILLPIFEKAISVNACSHSEFLREFVEASDAVVFTGRYEHLQQLLPNISRNQLLLYFGSGLVSFIVSDESDVELAAAGAVSDRMYNSGQDCICPDIFLVHTDTINDFLSALTRRLAKLRFGETTGLGTDYSYITDPCVVDRVGHYLSETTGRIVYGGQIDAGAGIIHPTIVLERSLAEFKFVEFFAPVFRVYHYASTAELLEFFNRPELDELKMGVSCFDNGYLADSLSSLGLIVARNRTFFDIEDGNQPFGGYGIRASHVRWRDTVEARPLLISRELQAAFCSSARAIGLGGVIAPGSLSGGEQPRSTKCQSQHQP